MSSPTEYQDTERIWRSAVLRARLAPFLSYGLAAAIFIVLMVMAFQAGFLPSHSQPPPTVERPEQITGDNSRISGFDREHQPYDVSARKGYQDKTNPDLAHLETVTGNFRRKTGETIQMLSGTAIYNAKSRQLQMGSGVKITQSVSFTAAMENANVDMQTKDLMSSVPVDVTMNGGSIRANGMKISNDGKTVLFFNGVKAHLQAAADKGDETP